MGTFKSEKTFFADQSLMSGIADAVENEFRKDNFEVQSVELGSGGYDISVAKGNVFKAVLGMKSALKITIEPIPHGIHVIASVGIFGQQAIPSAITFFIAWPVLVTQIWGMVQQSQLDDKAINIADEYINTHADNGPQEYKYCTYCGKKQAATNHICEQCGKEI